MRTLARDLVSSTSAADNWSFPLVNAGMCNLAWNALTESAPDQLIQHHHQVAICSELHNSQSNTCHSPFNPRQQKYKKQYLEEQCQ